MFAALFFISLLSAPAHASDIHYIGGTVSINTGNLTFSIGPEPEISAGSPGGQRIYLRYEALMGYSSTDSFGSNWILRADFSSADWQVNTTEQRDYTRIHIESTLDARKTLSSQNPIGNPQSFIVSQWCEVSFNITVPEKNMQFRNSKGVYNLSGGNEAKIEIGFKILKNEAGVDRIALKQSIYMPSASNYCIYGQEGNRKIAPGTGMPNIEHLEPLSMPEQRMDIVFDDKEKGHYLWESYATIGGDMTDVESYYTMEDEKFVVYISYPAISGEDISYDPVIGMNPEIPATEVYSEASGMLFFVIGAAAAGTGVTGIYLSVRKEMKEDPVLEWKNSKYIKK